MPKSLFVLVAVAAVVFFTSNTTPAQTPTVWHANYPAARKLSLAEKKPLLVVISTDQCVYCQKLDQNTLKEATTNKLLSEQFICLKINANKDPEFAKSMRVTMYPTTVVAGVDGKVYAYLAGYLEPKAFQENLGKALALMPKAVVEPSSPTATPKVSVVASQTKAPTPPTPTIVASTETDTTLSVAQSFKLLQKSIQQEPAKLEQTQAELEEQFARTFATLAEEHIKQGHLAEATELYSKVLAVAPSSHLATQAKERIQTLTRTPTQLRQERE